MATKKSPSLADYRYDAALKGSGRRFDLKRIRSGRQALLQRRQGARQGRGRSAGHATWTSCRTCSTPTAASSCWWCCKAPTPAGKDGTIRGVFGQMSALGVHTIGWKAPTEPERAHDYLWRIHQQVPADGEVMIFNRSHYEDVLVPVVSGWITPEQTAQRYAQINDFERMLTETGTVICKFLLHISKDEQRVRLQERLDDPTKHWKFAAGDLEARKQWDAYQKAYSAAVAATGTPWAPWTIVPADSKTHRNLMIATVMTQVLEALKLRYPPGRSRRWPTSTSSE